jgi:AmmeMemoRadiSam system protein A
MSESELTSEEKRKLLILARQSIETAVERKKLPPLDPAELTPALTAPGAAFVTLTIGGELRGCIGSLQAFRPLVEDVCEHAVDAAINDYRFLPITSYEVPLLEIEISRLSKPVLLPYSSPEELPGLLRPNIDGVVLRDGGLSATYLPQVWEQLPHPAEFLSHLCQKMGAPADLWKRKVLQVSIYQVEEFREG